MATTFKGAVSTFRIVGLASANHNLFSIFNKTGSTKFVKLKRLTFQTDATALNTAAALIVHSTRITAIPTGGTVITKVAFDTNLTADTNIEMMMATASDGGAATAITATAGSRMWADFKMHAPTMAGQFLFPDESIIPGFCDVDPIILRASQGILVSVVQAALTTDHYLVSCAWEETDSVP